MKLCVTESGFPEKFFLLPKLGKWTKDGRKTGFFEFIEKFCHQSLLNLFYLNENLYYCLCSCLNPIFTKIFVPEIWVKVFSANQIAGFYNQPCFQNKRMNQLDFLDVDTNSQNLKVYQKFFRRHVQKWVWPVWSHDSKIDCISRMSRWNKLVLCMVVEIQESEKLFQ